MSARGATNNVVATDLDLTSGSINRISIYDHLTPQLQDLLFEAKRFKTTNTVGLRTLRFTVLRQNDTSRSLTGSAISVLYYQTIWRLPKDLVDKFVTELRKLIWIFYFDRKVKSNYGKGKNNRLLLRGPPYSEYDIPSSHGQFNNLLPSNLPTKNLFRQIT